MTRRNSVLRVISGSGARREGRDLVGRVNALEGVVRAYDDDHLRSQTARFRERLERGEPLDDLLVEAFATVREAAVRVLGQRPYDEQILAGVVLHRGGVAEMRTGEGKALASIAPAYLNALPGLGVHIMTANDYLVIRDYFGMGRLFEWLGMRPGAVHPQTPILWMKRNGYSADVTYGTVTEFGFDYLRDNLAVSRDGVVQRGHHFALVDEADAVMIDEAQTPLILTGPGEVDQAGVEEAARFVAGLDPEDFDLDEAEFVVNLSPRGVEKAEEHYDITNLYDLRHVTTLHLVTQALRARTLFKRDKDYLVRDGAVAIVDEFTGRTLEGRRWSDGLHQAVEAKEGVAVRADTGVMGSVTIQGYLHLYDKLAGMTGTAVSDEEEFAHVYDLDVVAIPTHRPNRRVDHRERIYATHEAKVAAIVDEVVARHRRGQPVLIGTASVEHSEEMSRRLSEAGVEHAVLNAREHAREAATIAEAGRRGAVTVATNMAGRGVDILLGGDPERLAEAEARAREIAPDSDEGEQIRRAWRERCAAEGDEVRALGGLCVIGSERHESRRIDNQLRGRSGRQGDPGETLFFLAADDDLVRVFGGDRVGGIVSRVASADEPLTLKVLSRTVDRAQEAAETRARRAREELYEYDAVISTQRETLYGLRSQVIEGSRTAAEELERAIAGVAAELSEEWCAGFPEEWDVAGLVQAGASLTGVDMTGVTDGALDGDDVRRRIEEALRSACSKEDAEDGDSRDRILLALYDGEWREHLKELDLLREGIGWRSVAQTSPLSAWQREAFTAFEQMLRRVGIELLRRCVHNSADAGTVTR